MLNAFGKSRPQILDIDTIEDFDFNTEETSKLRQRKKGNWKGMRLPKRENPDKAYQDNFERSFDKFRTVFEP